MARLETSPLLARLQNPESLADQVAALRALKHELIGHDQRKEAWISWGIIPLLSKVLALRRGNGKKAATSGELNGTRKHSDTTRPRTDEEEACLQAVIIVGSLAQGGPAFISPILAGDILPSMLSILSSPGCPQWLTLPILKTLDTIADRFPLQNPNWPQDNKLAELLFSKEHVGCFAHIISQTSASQTTVSSVNLAAGLIAKLCTEETHKSALAEAGVLDALAFKVASFVVAQGFVLPGAENHLHEPGVLPAFPPPAPAGARLAPILRAVAVIIEHAKWRAELFLSSPGIVTVFPKQLPEFSPADIKKAPWGSTYLSGFAVPRPIANPIDTILPAVPVPQSKASSNFPPLVPHGSYGKHGQLLNTYLESAPDEEENAIVPWLLHVIRAESGMTRLMAARLLTVLFRLGLAKEHRIPMLSYLLIPVLIRMFDKDYEMKDESDPEYDGLIPTTLRLREEAPSVLATLVMDSKELQKPAVEGGAIKKLSQLLKETYNPLQENPKSMWHAESRRTDSQPEASPECRLGPAGYLPMVCHILRYRESILMALAAVAPSKDEYRKAICDHGAVPYIIDSLKPRPSQPAEEATGTKNTVADGNPTPTLLAACCATRSLTRSVSILRTSLIDAGVATPLFVLIKHPDIEVQIAATSVISNLALDFSPMKEAIISADILSILCDHAHSPNLKLRLESLWALKHIAYNSANDIKTKILADLGPVWLRQILLQDPVEILNRHGTTTDFENGSTLGMGTSNSAGEQVDLLNPMEDVRRDREEDLHMTDAPKSSTDYYLSDPAKRRKLALSAEMDRIKEAQQDEIAVQEQAFDLIRNTICGPGATEMADYIFREMGQNEVLDSLADKLRPRSAPVPSRRDSTSPKSITPVPVEILIAVTYVIVHLAAGNQRHRELLFSHYDLMKNLMSFFNHPNRYVRVNCVWTVLNLTFKDDHSDHQACQERALKLKALGAMDRLLSLEEDPDLDVRERTKTALNMMRTFTV
ncbi:hypothetical protein VTN96DRAFT_3457 [Rasamsonia emersonii]